MRIFQEVPLPPTCYLAEVALWAALGRLPKVLTKVSDFGADYSEGDPRTNREALDEDESILPYDPGFSQSELQHLGVEADWSRYAKIKNLLALEFPNLRRPSGADVIADYELRQTIHNDLGGTIRLYKDRAELDRIGAEVDWANSIDAEGDAAIDIARGDVFRCVVSGQVACFAWRDAPAIGAWRKAKAPLVQIPTSHWTMRNFDWDDSELRHSSGNYYAVQVKTADMMAAFPRPHCASRPTTLDLYPGCILMEDDGAGAQLPLPQRGRPAKGGGLIREAVINVFSHKASRGELSKKSEALVQEIQDFVELTFRTTVSRSTAQQYIKMLPENAAGKSA